MESIIDCLSNVLQNFELEIKEGQDIRERKQKKQES